MGDDQAGLMVAERLHRKNLPDTTVALEEAPGAGLADETLGETELLLVIDAARADCRHPAGSFLRINYGQHPRSVSAVSGVDTHTLGVAAGLELADALGLLPTHVWIYVIFGDLFDRCMTVSGAVEAAIPRLVRRIERDATQWIEARSCTS
jgi:hydrogenase maturation protease